MYNNFFEKPVSFRRMLKAIKLDSSTQPWYVLSAAEEKIILTSARNRDDGVHSLRAPVRVGQSEDEE